jgi:hypothetical protein
MVADTVEFDQINEIHSRRIFFPKPVNINGTDIINPYYINYTTNF